MNRLYFIIDRLASAAGWGALLAFMATIGGYPEAAGVSIGLALFWWLWGWVPPPRDL